MTEWFYKLLDIVGVLAIIGIAFKFGGLKAVLDSTSIKVVEIYEIVSKQDNRIQKLEDGKVDKAEFEKLKTAFTKLTTEHCLYHNKEMKEHE